MKGTGQSAWDKICDVDKALCGEDISALSATTKVLAWPIMMFLAAASLVYKPWE